MDRASDMAKVDTNGRRSDVDCVGPQDDENTSDLLSAACAAPGVDLCNLRQSFVGILIELTNGFSSVLMVDHLGQERRRNGDDVRSSESSGLNIHHGPDAPDDDLGRVVPGI